MKQKIKKIALVLAVVVLTLLFSMESPIWNESTKSKLTSMDMQDISITILDDDMVQVENNIKENGLLYTWVITNSINGIVETKDDLLALDYNDVIEFKCEDLAALEIQAVVHYDDYKYTSNTFGVDDNGELYVIEENASIESSSYFIGRDISDIVSLAYIAFIFVVVVLFYIVPKRFQWKVLLTASIFFYMLSGIQYILFIISASWVTYFIAKKMSSRKKIVDVAIKEEKDSKIKKALKLNLQKENKQLLAIALIVTLGIMIVIKYTDFILTNINSIANLDIPLLNLIMPLGLSFYSFILIAYLMDVYRGKYVAEESFFRFFLFASFFPQISQGPISRYNETSAQLKELKSFDYKNFCFGAQRILWGFFIKLVLADRIAELVTGVYGDYQSQSWIMLIIASLAYSIQIYADFYSSMEIALGTAQLFGIKLPENFLRPYFATSMPEFWRRWHVTLGTWFKEYVFYPISISKRIMKFSVWTRKKYGPNVSRVLSAIPPIMGVWILTGLWHGSSWNFVAWGLFHGTLILLSTAFSQSIEKGLIKIGIKTKSWDYKFLQMVKVFVLCTIGRIFFRTSSISMAFSVMLNTITLSKGNSLFSFGSIDLDFVDYGLLAITITMLLVVSILQEKIGSVREIIENSNIWIRWCIWFGLLFGTIIFGIYATGGSTVFIYDAF